MKNIRKKNINYLLLGYFFVTLSSVLIGFFLPFYLKEKGLNILQIGTFLTIGLAVGGLIASIVFSRLQRKISLKAGLGLSSILYFLTNLIFYTIPTSVGVIISNVFSRFASSGTAISSDVTLQHNSLKKEHRKISNYLLIADSLGISIGLLLSVFLIKKIGFLNSTLVFSFLAILSIFFFVFINDKTRFKSKTAIHQLPTISFGLKLILLSEILYWLGLASSFSLVITFLVTDKFGSSIEWISILFLTLYISITLTTLIAGKFLNKTNLYKSSIFGMCLLLLSAIVVIFSTNLYSVAIAMILEGIGAGIWVPSKTALYWGRTKPELREIVSGYLQGFRQFAKIIGPLFGGLLVYFLGILAPFYFKTLIALISIFIYSYLWIKRDDLK